MILKNMRFCIGVFILLESSLAFSQEDLDAKVNPNSIFNIPAYEMVYKVRVWRELDLKEKQNGGFFAFGNEIGRLIMDALRSGQITKAYKSDSLSEKSSLNKAEVLEKFQLRPKQIYNPWDQNVNYAQGERVIYNGLDYECTQDGQGQLPDAPAPNDYWVETSGGKEVNAGPRDIFKLEIVEELIFDKRRSRLYYDVQGINLIAWDAIGNGYRPIAWFKYKDLERVFRANPEKAVWFNRQNTAQNRNFADAFLLRLFHASIKKIENPDDLDLSSLYPNYKESVLAREWEEMKLMEKEHNLWEY